MANNKDKIDTMHDLLPQIYRTRVNPNWKAIVGAIGQADADLAHLITQIRDQFFIKSASAPYLDRLADNYNVVRPKTVGMDDVTYRRYIPIMTYQPKQVKLVMDILLDIFFFKETTTAFIETTQSDIFTLKDGWTLQYLVDGIFTENIVFNATDFSDISQVTASELVSVINRSAKYSFAILNDDKVLKKKFVRIFTNTIGSKGSILMVGGLAISGLKPTGFLTNAGSQYNTIWTITKVGESMIFTWTGGNYPGLNNLMVGDIAAIDIPGNYGSFIVSDVNLSNNSFSVNNLFGTSGVWDHLANPDSSVIFVRPERIVVYKNPNRAVAWEVNPGEIIIEMPATPPVVRRQLKGSAHINGLKGITVNRVSNTELELNDATDWPSAGGQFVLQPKLEIKHHFLSQLEDAVGSDFMNARFDKAMKFSYTGKNGNILQGITPDLPPTASIHENTVLTLSRDINQVTTVTLLNPDTTLVPGKPIFIQNSTLLTGTAGFDGRGEIEEVLSTTSFTFKQLGDIATGSGGIMRYEQIELSNSDSFVYLTTAQTSTGIVGPYVWDSNATFVLSSVTADILNPVVQGYNPKTLFITPNNSVPNEEGFLIFDFGTEKEEGPVRYLFKPSDDVIQLDPTYIFKYNHDVGSGITVIRRKGNQIMGGFGAEKAFYVTDPTVARQILQDLLSDVKSAGIFLTYYIKYPNQLYGTLDVYQSGNTSLWPIQSP